MYAVFNSLEVRVIFSQFIHTKKNIKNEKYISGLGLFTKESLYLRVNQMKTKVKRFVPSFFDLIHDLPVL